MTRRIVLPAMGDGDQQIAELRTTVRAADRGVAGTGTPWRRGRRGAR